MIPKTISFAWSLFQQLLFPVYCLHCSREGFLLCGECAEGAPSVIVASCLLCGVASPFGKICGKCEAKFSLDGLIARGLYYDWCWQALVRTWKYRNARALEPLLLEYLKECFDYLPVLVGDFIVMPVPLARKRHRLRGFNQADVLAKCLSDYFEAPRARVLKRVRETKPQFSLTSEERKENVAGAFICREPDMVKGKLCLLVDDIVTTGATMNECAKVLKKSGATVVWGIALARSENRPLLTSKK